MMMIPHHVSSHSAIRLDELVHESQSLQLCAVHSVNNLLQLSKTDNDDDENGGNRNERFLLCGGKLYKTPNQAHHTQDPNNNSRNMMLSAATQREFDLIADEMSRREDQILSTSDANGTHHDNNLYETLKMPRRILTNNHRSLFCGNYSLEVLETALIRRGVLLERYCKEKDDSVFLSSPSCTAMDATSTSVSTTSNHVSLEKGLLIGFIIHSIQEDLDSSFMSFSSLWRRIFHMSGHHWYAITRLQRVLGELDHVDLSEETIQEDKIGLREQEETIKNERNETWYLLDSRLVTPVILSSNHELKCTLEDIQQNGGSVLKAIVPIL